MTKSNQKVAIVTGATAGMGEAIARKLAEDGFSVVLAARRKEKGEALKDEIEARSGSALFIQTDITKGNDIKNLHERTLSHFGRLDVAVNNAGVFRGQSLTESGVEDYDSVMDTNLKAVWLSMKFQIEAIRKHGEGGSIINIASNAGHNGLKNAALYVASKHAVLGLTKAAALDYAEDNIRVNAVSPGPIRTEMLQGAIESNPQVEEYFTNLVPLGRIGSVEDVAHTVSWLASDKATYITGHSLAVDGGTLAGFNN